MAVDGFQLIKIVGIWMFVAWTICAATIGIVGVIHAGSEVGSAKPFILMSESKVMCNFLAHHQTSPRRCVVLGGVVVGIVHFCNCLGNMVATCPDLRNAQPAIVTVFGITDFDASGSCAAILGVGPACHFCQIQHSGRVPIGNGFIEIGIPSGGYVIADL